MNIDLPVIFLRQFYIPEYVKPASFPVKFSLLLYLCLSLSPGFIILYGNRNSQTVLLFCFYPLCLQQLLVILYLCVIQAGRPGKQRFIRLFPIPPGRSLQSFVPLNDSLYLRIITDLKFASPCRQLLDTGAGLFCNIAGSVVRGKFLFRCFAVNGAVILFQLKKHLGCSGNMQLLGNSHRQFKQILPRNIAAQLVPLQDPHQKNIDLVQAKFQYRGKETKKEVLLQFQQVIPDHIFGILRREFFPELPGSDLFNLLHKRVAQCAQKLLRLLREHRGRLDFPVQPL